MYDTCLLRTCFPGGDLCDTALILYNIPENGKFYDLDGLPGGDLCVTALLSHNIS